MRHFRTILITLGFLCVAGITANQVQEKAAPPGAAELIEKLGSPKFVEREQAMKELESLGAATLPLLRTALKSNDGEIRRRAAVLVRKFEDEILATKLLAGKRVRLNLKDAFISDAEDELTKQGFQVRRPAEVGQRSDIKITLDTGETTFWEALHQVGAKITAAAPKIGESEKPRAPNYVEMPFFGSTKIPLGESVSRPVCFAGAARITLLKALSLPNGEIDFTLEVVCEPHLLDFANAGSVRIDKAIDDQGKLLSLQPGIEKPAKVVVKGNIATAAIAVVPTVGFQSSQLSVRLTGTNSKPKLLTEVSGKIPVTTSIESEPMMHLDNVLSAAGQTAKSKEGKTLKLVDIRKAGNGEITVSVEMENPVQDPTVGPVGIAIQIGDFEDGKLVGPGGESAREFIAGSSSLRLLDTKGKDFTQAGVIARSSLFSSDGWHLKEITVFSPTPGQGQAARLMLPGYRSFSFEVPFTFKNIPLNQDR